MPPWPCIRRAPKISSPCARLRRVTSGKRQNNLSRNFVVDEITRSGVSWSVRPALPGYRLAQKTPGGENIHGSSSTAEVRPCTGACVADAGGGDGPDRRIRQRRQIGSERRQAAGARSG